MTREEAISILKQYIDYNNPDVTDFYTMEEAIEVVIKALEQEPCDDAISRQAVLEILNNAYFLKLDDGAALQESVNQLPPVKPQYTDAEIQKMQDLESAEIQKAYEIGKLEQESCDDCVSRQAVLEIQEKYAEHIGATKFWQMRDDIKALQPVTPQPKMGEWYLDDEWRCSVCNCVCEDWRGIPTYKYCPQCGSYVGKRQEVKE